jgi:hypothetical protein
MSVLQAPLEVRERRDVALPVLVDPPVVDEPDRHRVQEVQLLPPRPARDHEARVLQHAQVLHDAEARHRQLRLQLGQRAPVARVEPVEQEPPGGIRERLEHAVVIRHVSKYR